MQPMPWKEISELEAGGATPMRNAVEAAFDAADSGQLIDTLYILSDGEPTDASASNVLRTVSKRNKDHYMVIHTIAIGEDSALLKTISQEHEGNHIWSSTGKF